MTADPTPILPLDLGAVAAGTAAGAPLVLEADVVVVGSGAGGGVVAADLAGAGRSVVVLEAGPFVAEADMPVDELSGFHRLYLNKGLTVSRDASVLTMAGAGVGGGTVVNWMTCLAPPAGTREAWREHGLAMDDADLGAEVARLEGELGVAPSDDPPAKDALIRDGAAALGIEAGPIRRNGVGCTDCGRCGFGCRAGAKQSGIRVHLAAAWRDGARVVPDAPVTRVLLEHGRAVGAEASVVVDGRPRRLVVRAPQVVVAAGTLRSPLVLERSGIAHPSLGRHLRLHPVSVLGAILPFEAPMWRGTMQAVRSVEHLEDPAGRFVVESAPGTPGLIALVFPWEGRAGFRDLMERDVRRTVPVLGIVADRGEGRVRASRHGRAVIDYQVARADRVTLRRALATSARIARAGGAERLVAVGTPPAWFDRTAGDAAFARYLERLGDFDYAPNRGTVVSAHQMGTVRAGADPRTHPCDPAGRVRTGTGGAVVPGLYVGDASLFPTALGVNPMITTMVLARRVARMVLAEGASGA